MAIFPIRERIFTGAAGVSPPCVLRKCTCRNAAAKSRETAIGAFTKPGAVAVAKPRGANAPRSCVAVRMSAGEKRIFALHKRRFNQERRALARRACDWTNVVRNVLEAHLQAP
jgi:hypothetical protein